jgi:hypothetical protein
VTAPLLNNQLSQAVYRIDEDQPGRRLVLVWQGRAPRRALRWLAFASAIGMLAAAFWFARNEVLPVVNKGMQQPGGDPIGLAVLGGILVVGACVGAFYLVRGAGSATRYVSRTSWDANDAVFEVVESGWMLFARRRKRVPLGTIRSLEMKVGSETSRGGLPVRLVIAFSRDGEPEVVVQSLPIQSVDRRTEAMDLLFRIARITGHSRYQVMRSDPRELRIALLRDVDDEDHTIDDETIEGDFDDDEDDLDEEELEDDDSDEAENDTPDGAETTAMRGIRGLAVHHDPQIFPVPLEQGAARYEVDEPPRGFVEPDVEIPPLNVDELANELAPAHLAEWDPRGLARTTRDPVPRAVLYGCGVLAALAGAGLGAWALHGFVSMLLFMPPSRWDCAGFGALVGGLMGPLLIWAFNRQRDVTIDRTAGTITCRHGEVVRNYALDELCEVTLIGEERRQNETTGSGTKRSSRTHTEYRCRVELALGQAGEWVFESGEWDRDPNRPYRRLLGFSIELARMLGVPWRWQDDGEQNTAQWFGRLGWKERGAVLALVLSIVCYPALLVIKEQASKRGAARIEEMGGQISFLNGYTIGDHKVLENYWKVEFQPAQFDYDKLRAIVPALSQIERAGLILSGTGMGDSGMALLPPANNLLLLDLNSTGVTSEGLDALASFDRLEYLSMANTIVGDSGLERLAPLPRLRFLMLATTQVTDAGLAQLGKFPKLEYVGLHNLPLSAEAIDQLQRSRSGLTIAR